MMECLTDEKKSTHRAEVVRITLEPIPGADNVALARAFGYSCVTAKSQWAENNLAAYIPPDSLVDVTRPEFAFLADQAKADGKARIKAKKIRGVLSFGLLVPAPVGSCEGDDVTEQLGVVHYEPAVRQSHQNRTELYASSEVASGPNVPTVKYDVDAGRRYAQLMFMPGEPVCVTEKIHGANARYVFSGGQMHCGSRTEWKREYPDHSHVTVEMLAPKVGLERAQEVVAKLAGKPKAKNQWWQALDRTPSLRKFCEANPDAVVYGEVYGAVQDLRYGHINNDISFAAFDVMRDGEWLDPITFLNLMREFNVPTVPIIASAIPFDFDRICELAEGQSLVVGANHVREGVVVSPLVERRDDRLGRVKLKWVGAGYLERSK